MIPDQLMLLHLEGYNYSVFDLTRKDRVQIQVTFGIITLFCALLALLIHFFTLPKKVSTTLLSIAHIVFFFTFKFSLQWIFGFLIICPYFFHSGCSQLLNMNLYGTLTPELGKLSHLDILFSWYINLFL